MVGIVSFPSKKEEFMRIIHILGLALAVSLTACGGGGKKDAEVTKAKGTIKGTDGETISIYKGGVFKMNQVDKPTTLFPHGVGELTGHNIANQLYEGLVKLDQATLEVKPCLAEDIQINEDGTVFTYTLRKGVKFHDDPCFKNAEDRILVAQDVKYCFDQLCTPNSKTKTKQNELGGLVLSKIKGAQEYFDSFGAGSPLEGGVEGVKVIDDHTIEVTLVESFAGFNNILSTPAGWIFPEEAVDKYEEAMRDHPVGTGPFMGKTVKLDKNVYLKRNPEYWDTDEHGNALPYLEMLKFTFTPEKKAEFLNFNKGDLDMVWRIPVDEIDNVLQDLNDAKNNAKQVLQSVDGITIQYYAFLQGSPVFDDIRVRKAFNLAIDREELVNSALYGEGTPAEYGIVPPMNGYPHENVKGYTHDVDEARKLLAEAGYPNGQDFPEVTLVLNKGGNINMILAEAIQAQLKENLGVVIQFDPVPLNQLRLKFETGNADFWRAAWVADYPDPENFLNLFHGKHVPEDPKQRTFYNAMRYKNAKFDELYDKAVKTLDQEERMRLFAEADQILIDDAVVMPIYYDSYERLLNKKVKNFPINGMEYRDFTRVFFDEN